MSTRTVVTFNGTTLTDLYDVSDLRTTLLHRTLGSVDVPGRDGAVFTGAKLAARKITLTFTVKDQDIAARQAASRALAATLAVDSPKPLSLSIDDGLYYLAIPTSDGDASRFVGATQFDVSFMAYDPVMYGDQVSFYVYVGNSHTWTVNGTYPTLPLIRCPRGVPEWADNPIWQITLDGSQTITVDITGYRQYANIVIDCQNRILTVDGNAKMLPATCDWFSFEPGQHTLSVSGGEAGIVSYRERWL